MLRHIKVWLDRSITHILNKLSLRQFIPAIIWFFILMTLICLPKDKVPRVNDWWNQIYIDKWIHAGLFGLQAFLLIVPFLKLKTMSMVKKKNSFTWIAIGVCVWGLVTECIQLYIPGRSFDLMDWAADSLGVGLVYFFSLRYQFPS